MTKCGWGAVSPDSTMVDAAAFDAVIIGIRGSISMSFKKRFSMAIYCEFCAVNEGRNFCLDILIPPQLGTKVSS